MKHFLMACLVLFTANCTPKNTTEAELKSVVCQNTYKAIYNASEGVAKSLDCKNVAAIASDLSSPLSKLNLCEQSAQGLMGEMICPQVSKYVKEISVQALPAAWECSGGPVAEALEQTVSAGCRAAITF